MKKILLIGFIVVLLIAIPVTVFLVQQQNKTKSGAVAATTISILPPSQAPIHVGDDVNLNIQVNPATATTSNLVSYVKFTILYDSTKLATDGAGLVTNSTTNPTHVLPDILQGPVYGDGTISITLSAGGDPSQVVQQITNIGTITFKALATTDSGPTQITFGNDVQVWSLGSTAQSNENVLASANPAALTIIAGAVVSPTPTATPTATPTPAPTATPTATPTANAPTCTSLTADTTSGDIPLSTNLTVNGASNNSTISKVTFTFGDGQSQDITASGGIGTNSVNVLQSHTYSTAGTFTATATLTDANNAASNSTTCAVTITAANPSGGAASTTTAAAPTATPTQVIAQVSPLLPTGPADLVKVGSLGAVITLIGAVLLFAL
jgi:hypothetical protein